MTFSVFGQENWKINRDLMEYLESTDTESSVPLLVECSQPAIAKAVEDLELKINLDLSPLYSVEIPAKHIPEFSGLEGLKTIEFSLQPGRSFSDTMLINTNADSIIQIHSPLNYELSGKGVIIGFIDSGIDINHPDFQDSTGKTRILHIWDQKAPFNPARQAKNYSYGVAWDSASINSGICTHDDQAAEFGHGSMVSGAAASNGLATGFYRGMAPKSNIIAVSTDYNKVNWLQTVAEGVDYIFTMADSLQMPCVINASVGTYRGSHDGKDLAARMIDLLVKQKSGRAMVCAAGNAGNLKFHLQHNPQNDSMFTWFEHHPALFAGQGGVYYEIWSDTSDFKSIQFAFGADRENNGNYEFRGRTAYHSLSGNLNQIVRDSIISKSGNLLAYIDYYAEESQGRYKVEVAMIQPDSSNYLFRFESRGTGKLDIWSSYALQRSSEIISQNLPTPGTFPAIGRYKKPDSLQTIASSFTCLPSIVTVGNYINRNTYVDVNGQTQNMGAIPGKMSEFSSLGPNRLGDIKPDLSSAGDFMMSSGRIATMNQLIQQEPSKISLDSMHMRNGGTSMASPTVAGMVALYLEQCPQLNYQSIKNKLILTAKKDSYTPNSGSFKWGAGKADAFRFVSNSSFKPNLNLTSSSFCGVDSVQINLSTNYQSYLWNTGDTSSSIYARQSGNYFVWVQNSASCRGKSDSINLNFYPLPPKPQISQIADTLSISGQGLKQWYFNNNIIPGANSSTLIAQNSGSYFCELADSITNCNINSDTLLHFITGENEYSTGNFEIFPNPGEDLIYFNLASGSLPCNLSIYDLQGKLIFNQQVNKQQLSLNLSLLDAGLYLVRLSSSNLELNRKLILK